MKRLSYQNDIIEELHNYNIDVGNRQIYLHANIQDEAPDCDVDYKSATKFLKNMMLLESISTNPITIHQFSYGGYFESGMLIYDVIAESSSHVTIICHGAAMSMSTIILQAADVRIAMPNCLFMVHEGSVDISGSFKKARSSFEIDKKLSEKHLDIYAKKCVGGEYFKGKDESQIKKFIHNKFSQKEDWYLTAEEALCYGFIDKILDDKLKKIAIPT